VEHVSYSLSKRSVTCYNSSSALSISSILFFSFVHWSSDSAIPTQQVSYTALIKMAV